MRAAIAGMLLCASLLSASSSTAATYVSARHDRATSKSPSAHTAVSPSFNDVVADVAAAPPPTRENVSPSISFVADGSRLKAQVVVDDRDEDRYLANFRIPPGARQAFANGSAKNGPIVGLLLRSDVPEPSTWTVMLLGLCLVGAGLRRRVWIVRAGAQRTI